MYHINTIQPISISFGEVSSQQNANCNQILAQGQQNCSAFTTQLHALGSKKIPEKLQEGNAHSSIMELNFLYLVKEPIIAKISRIHVVFLNSLTLFR